MDAGFFVAFPNEENTRSTRGKPSRQLIENTREKMAERVGFEPTCPLLAGKTLSRRPRYDRFGTSPQGRGHCQCGDEIIIAR